LIGDDGQDLLIGGEGKDNIYGGAKDDGLFGGDGADLLVGGDGDDILIGGANPEGPTGDSFVTFDILLGGAGDDLLIGGAGEDFLDGGSGNDTLVGSDILQSELAPAEYEQLRSNPAGGLRGTGNAGFKPETGLNYDELRGGDGDDTLFLSDYDVGEGGIGNDTFVLGDWTDFGQAATILDFDVEEDVIVIATAPGNSDYIITTQVDGNRATILVDGAVLANVQGTFDPDNGLDGSIIRFTYQNV
jgi:Ca2+-binding RTX toxin-like protein